MLGFSQGSPKYTQSVYNPHTWKIIQQSCESDETQYSKTISQFTFYFLFLIPISYFLYFYYYEHRPT